MSNSFQPSRLSQALDNTWQLDSPLKMDSTPTRWLSDVIMPSVVVWILSVVLSVVVTMQMKPFHPQAENKWGACQIDIGFLQA